MKTATHGTPSLLQNPYTRFYIHYLDLNRLEELLDEDGISYFAMEMRTSNFTWIIHIPDTHRPAFNELVVKHQFNLSAMHQSFWYQDRQWDAMWQGSRSRSAGTALLVVIVVMLILAIAAYLFD